MHVAPLYHSLVIIYVFICSYLLFFIIYSFSSFFSLFSFFFFSFLINCFYLLNYLFFLFIGLAYCVSTAIQVFLLARKFNINTKYSTKILFDFTAKILTVNFIMAKNTFTLLYFTLQLE